MKNTSLITYGALAILVIAVAFWSVGLNSVPTGRSDSGMVSTALEGTRTFAVQPQPIELGQIQRVTWAPSDYDATGKVSVNIIRKIGNNPARYELVRSVAVATANDGSATWVPAATDIGKDLFVEIGCRPSEQACRASISVTPLAVNYSAANINTASAYAAIEAAQNK